MLRKFALIALLALPLVTLALSGCATNSSKPYAITGADNTIAMNQYGHAKLPTVR